MTAQSVSPFQGYELLPLVSLEEAIQPLVGIVPDIEQMLKIVRENGDQSSNHLSSDESASIRLYTLPRRTVSASFRVILSETLKSPTQQTLSPWFPYLRLFIHALSKLPSLSELPSGPLHTVYYGLQEDAPKEYQKDEIIIWWDFLSCTSSIEVLQNSMDENRPRSIFIIECDSAKDIRNYLWNEDQNKIILYPARRFQVISSFDCNNQLKFIQLKEVSQPPLIKMVRPPSINPFPPLTPKPDLDYNVIDRHIHHSKADLAGLKLTDKHMNIVVQHAIITKQCQQLFLSHNLITSSGSVIIANALDNNTTLKSLSLAYNKLCKEGVQSLAHILSLNNSKLETLSLHSNEITDEGVKYLCDMLEKNTTLTWLHLGKNKISDIGVKFLSDVLSSDNKTLKALSLASNELITDESVEPLVEMFNNNKFVETFWIDDCKLSPAGKKKLQKITKSNKQLFVLTV